MKKKKEPMDWYLKKNQISTLNYASCIKEKKCDPVRHKEQNQNEPIKVTDKCVMREKDWWKVLRIFQKFEWRDVKTFFVSWYKTSKRHVEPTEK